MFINDCNQLEQWKQPVKLQWCWKGELLLPPDPGSRMEAALQGLALITTTLHVMGRPGMQSSVLPLSLAAQQPPTLATCNGT